MGPQADPPSPPVLVCVPPSPPPRGGGRNQPGLCFRHGMVGTKVEGGDPRPGHPLLPPPRPGVGGGGAEEGERSLETILGVVVGGLRLRPPPPPLLRPTAEASSQHSLLEAAGGSGPCQWQRPTPALGRALGGQAGQRGRPKRGPVFFGRGRGGETRAPVPCGRPPCWPPRLSVWPEWPVPARRPGELRGVCSQGCVSPEAQWQKVVEGGRKGILLGSKCLCPKYRRTRSSESPCGGLWRGPRPSPPQDVEQGPSQGLGGWHS